MSLYWNHAHTLPRFACFSFPFCQTPDCPDILLRCYCTGWFRLNPIKKLRVGSPRRFWEIGSEILHTCSMSTCQLVNERCFMFVRYLVVPFVWGIWDLRHPKLSSEKHAYPSLPGRQRLTEHVFEISGSIPRKRLGLFGFCLQNM